MLTRTRIEDIPKITVSSSLTVTNSYSHTTTTVTSGGFSRRELRSTVSGDPSSYLSPTTGYRSAFNNQPIANYRSFNVKKSEPIDDKPLEKKKSKSLMSFLFKSNVKEKEVKKEETKNKETKKKADKKSEKNKNETSVISVDARQIMPLPNNSYKLNYTPLADMRDMNKRLVVKVTKTGKICGTENETVPTYLTNSKYRRGKVLLINNIEFTKKEKYRAGAEVDQMNITKLFRDMGFTINDHKNKTKKDMEKIIANYCADSSLKRADINITIIMSHGNGDYSNTYIETVDNDCVEIKWIVEQFSNSKCIYLANKPKIFIFQCCRGSSSDIQVDSGVFQTPTATRTASDMLLAFATVPGYVSHRDTKLGTWYIQSICKIFMEHAHNIHVEDLLKIVDKNLKNMNLTRQTSSYENRGFKRCYLNPI